MTRHRIAVIGLGMAVTPHAKSLLDLRDRIEVACAFSPGEPRRQAFAQRFRLSHDGDLGQSPATLDRCSDDPHAAQYAPGAGGALRRGGQAHPLEKPLERSTERALRLVEAAEAAGVKLVVFQHRFRGFGAFAHCCGSARSGRSP